MNTQMKEALMSAPSAHEGQEPHKEEPTMTNTTSLHIHRQIDRIMEDIARNNLKLRAINKQSLNASTTEFEKLSQQFTVYQQANTKLTRQLRELIEKYRTLAEQERQEQAATQAARKAHDKRVRATIAEITRRDDLNQIDLPYELIHAYRRGGDYMRYLEAMKAADDLDLERAGRTSWEDEGDDADD